MVRRNSVTVILLVTALLALHPTQSRSQEDVITALALERYGILTTPGTGARPYGMGGAYTAVSDDAFALLYNPAGLAQVTRGEVSIGIHHSLDELTNTYLTDEVSNSSSYTKLGHLSIVYPSPTYLGNLAFGFGIFRAGSSELDYVRKGSIIDIPADIENIYMQSGSIWQYHFGAGMEVTPMVSLGGSFVIWDESIDLYEEIVDADPGSTAVFTDDVKLNLDGISFNLGIHIRTSEFLRFGLVISSPAWLTYKGDGLSSYSGTYVSSPDLGWSCDSEYGLIEEEFTLPWHFRGGVAFELEPVMVTADVSYVDYSQTKWYGLRLVNELDPSRESALKSVWNFHVGAEFRLPAYPVSFRAGYYYMPLIPAVMEEIVYIEEPSSCEVVLPTDLYEYAIVRERQAFTMGAGVLIDDALTLELGVSLGGYERDSGILTEKRDIKEFVISSSFQF